VLFGRRCQIRCRLRFPLVLAASCPDLPLGAFQEPKGKAKRGDALPGVAVLPGTGGALAPTRAPHPPLLPGHGAPARFPHPCTLRLRWIWPPPRRVSRHGRGESQAVLSALPSPKSFWAGSGAVAAPLSRRVSARSDPRCLPPAPGTWRLQTPLFPLFFWFLFPFFFIYFFFPSLLLGSKPSAQRCSSPRSP